MQTLSRDPAGRNAGWCHMLAASAVALLLTACAAPEQDPAHDAGAAFTPPAPESVLAATTGSDTTTLPAPEPAVASATPLPAPTLPAPRAASTATTANLTPATGGREPRSVVTAPVTREPPRVQIAETRPEPPPAPATAPSVQFSEVLFQSTPPGALVRLTSKDGRVVGETTTPATLRVPADEYTWEVQLASYLTDRSGPLGLQLFARRSDTVAVLLTRADDRRAILERANAAFSRRGGCTEAVRLYESIRSPNEMGGDLGTEWTESRMRLGQCYKEMREYDRAIRAFDVVVSSRPGQWSAKFESGMTSCSAQDFENGIISFRDMGGAFLGRVDASRKRAVQLLARYGTAVCRVQQLERLGDTERNRDLRETSLGSLDEFISGVETFLGGETPAELKVPLEQALRDARAKRDNLSRT